MHEKRFAGDIARLRSPERMERLEVRKVVGLCLEGVSLRNVLDIGTGSGLFAEAFEADGLEVAGIDASPEMIAAARQYVPHATFLEAPAEELPFPEEWFDLVFLGVVLHESDNPLAVLQEARRVSRNRVCVLEWAYKPEPLGPPLAHRISAESINDMLQKAGYSSWEALPLTNLVLYRLKR